MEDHQTPIQQRQCGHKMKYTETEAKRAAKAMHKRVKARFNPYLCQWCEFWHVGTHRSVEAAQRRTDRRGIA
jgi:hypothetical protein